jgi:osmotically-inducible protein OsmY
VGSGYAALAFVSCDINQNLVILSGSVPSYHLKQLAQVFAQRVEGVGRVDNRLEVRRRRLV